MHSLTGMKQQQPLPENTETQERNQKHVSQLRTCSLAGRNLLCTSSELMMRTRSVLVIEARGKR